MEAYFIVLIIVGILIFLGLIRRLFIIGKQCTISRDLRGGNTGIGEETTKVLSSMGATVVIAARDMNKSQSVLDEIGQKYNTVGYAVKLDLSDLISVQECVKAINSLNLQKIDILINNAGIMGTSEFQISNQGFERQFATNYLGHFYLTKLLIPLLNKSSSPRIINVSSDLHRKQQVSFSDIQSFELRQNWNVKNTLIVYANTKVYNILHGILLEEKFGIKGWYIQFKYNCSLHPGVVRTGLAQSLVNNKCKQFIFCLIYPCFAFFTKNSLQGSQTTLQCALIDVDELQSGGYYHNCQIREPSFANKQKAHQLWEITESLLQNGIQNLNN